MDETRGPDKVEQVKVVDFMERKLVGLDGAVDCVGEEECGG